MILKTRTPPRRVYVYFTSPSFSTSRPSTPVSSPTSRTAVSSGRSPGSMFPFGSAQTPPGLPRGRIAASIGRPRITFTRTPPAENSRSITEVCTRLRWGPGATRMPWHSRGESASLCQRSSQEGGRMNLKPLGDRLIVEVLEEEEQTISGIVLPDTAKEKPQRGRVLAVGPGSRNDKGELVPMDVAEGDEVIFSKYGGTEIKVETDEVLILRESDVLAKVIGTREPAGATA